jgi:hypothetical protein
MVDDNGRLKITCPRAKILIQRKEWEIVLHPMKRSISTFLPITYEVVKDSKDLEIVEGAVEVAKGVTVSHTGDYNRGTLDRQAGISWPNRIASCRSFTRACQFQSSLGDGV